MQPFSLPELKEQLATLSKSGVYLGTSSWKYEGWLDLVYTRERYMTRTKFSHSKFDSTCLREYAECFKTVCLDGGYYQFPTEKMIKGVFEQVPKDFQLSLKVTEDITAKSFSSLPRYGKRAGQTNINFLNANLFTDKFLGPLNPYQSQIGTLFFEFSHFRTTDWKRGRDFVHYLDNFLGQIPCGWNYSVEVRNASLLQTEYFDMLRGHGVAHAYNSWSKMPSIPDQLALPASQTADFISARFLLRPKRTYEEAVKQFHPYSEIRDLNPEARQAIAQLANPQPRGGSRRRYLYVNNRLEGSSPRTIQESLRLAGDTLAT